MQSVPATSSTILAIEGGSSIWGALIHAPRCRPALQRIIEVRPNLDLGYLCRRERLSILALSVRIPERTILRRVRAVVGTTPSRAREVDYTFGGGFQFELRIPREARERERYRIDDTVGTSAISISIREHALTDSAGRYRSGAHRGAAAERRQNRRHNRRPNRRHNRWTVT